MPRLPGLDPGDQARDRVQGAGIVARRREAAPDRDEGVRIQGDPSILVPPRSMPICIGHK
jgi:hypothetical protein